MHLFLTWLTNNETIINNLWLFTLISMVVLYISCNLLPDRIVGNILPLHNVFRPKKNVDLDFQSIGYAMLHTKWIARITHYTIIIDSMLWFVIFRSWHWSVPVLVLLAILIQAVFIGEKKFALSFILMGLAIFAGSLCTVHYLGMHNAVLFSKFALMTGGLMRMLGHTVELMPPLLLDGSDKFVKLTIRNITWKIPVVGFIGIIAEFSSGLPNRLLPVQVNFLYQAVFRVSPSTTLAWQEIEASAKKVLTGGYSQLSSLENYYNGITQNKSN